MLEKRRSGRASTKTSIRDEIAHLRGLDLKGSYMRFDPRKRSVSLHAHISADFNRRHRKIPRLRDDPRNRSSLCEKACARFRREGVRHDPQMKEAAN
jgi:hypothetical protein